MNDLYSTTDLLALVQVQKPFEPFFLNHFFPGLVTSQTESISFDEVTEDESIAVFCSPLVKGVPDRKKGGVITSFKPAYLKPTDDVRPTDMLVRRPGEQINGDSTPETRYEDAVAENVQKQERKIVKRIEVMCVEALVTGKVIVKGDDYPEQEVDYNRDPSLDIVLAGTDKWDDDASNLIASLEDASMSLLDICGKAGSDIVVTPSVWKVMLKHKDFIKQLEVRRGVGDMPDITPKKAAYVSYKGSWGDFNIWVYANSYKDVDGNSIKPFDGNKMLMVANGVDGLNGYQAYGAIFDKKAGLEALPRFLKMWDIEDPSATLVQTQSAPLPLPLKINASLIMEVF